MISTIRVGRSSWQSRTSGVVCGLTLLAAAFQASADVSADVKLLPLRRDVLLPRDIAGGWYAIVEDSTLAAGAGPEFADLRLVDAEGRSRPFYAEAPAQSRSRSIVLRELPVVWTESEEGSREMIFELDPALPSRLSVELTGLSANFPFHVTGRDSAGGDWVVLPIDSEESSRAVPSPTSRVDLRRTRRFLRLQQNGASPPGADDRVLLLERGTISTSFSAVEFRADPGRFRGKGGDEWRAEIHVTGPPRALTRLGMRWTTGAPRDRSPRLEARLPRGGWRDLQFDRPTSDRAPRDGVESLVFDPVRTGALRLSVFGADAPNEPCTIEFVHAAPQRWLFRVAGPESLALAYGDPYLVTPAAAEEAPPRDAEVRDVTLGPPGPNPLHREPQGLEWLKRRPTVLGTAMIVLLGLVAWLALARRQVRAEGIAG